MILSGHRTCSVVWITFATLHRPTIFIRSYYNDSFMNFRVVVVIMVLLVSNAPESRLKCQVSKLKKAARRSGTCLCRPGEQGECEIDPCRELNFGYRNFAFFYFLDDV